MFNHKYHSVFTLCVAGLLLSIFSPRKMRQYYPTEFCRDGRVKRYLFSKHSWVLAEEREAERKERLAAIERGRKIAEEMEKK